MAVMITKNIAMAVKTMRASRGRSFLTMLGVVIAVASVTSIVSIGNGIQSAITKQANQYSKNVVTVRPKSINGADLNGMGPAGVAASLTSKDATTIGKVPHVSSSVPLSVVGSAAMGDKHYNGTVFAVSSDLPTVLNQEIAFGGFFTTRDSSNSVAVLGATAADAMFDERVPLGRAFTIRGQQFIVGGVLSKFDSTPFTGGSNFNNAIFVPASAATALAPNGAPIYEILAKISDQKYLAEADSGIAKALAKSHSGQSDYNVLTPNELANETVPMFDLLAQFIIAAALITLLVSGIGIMNVMLVSVTERIHEIGIRKAVGATNRQILNQFVTEAATLCFVGSLIGVVVAYIVVLLLLIFTSLTPIYDVRVAVLACVAACIFGIIFGSLPAIKAARKDPIAALRSE